MFLKKWWWWWWWWWWRLMIIHLISIVLCMQANGLNCINSFVTQRYADQRNMSYINNLSELRNVLICQFEQHFLFHTCDLCLALHLQRMYDCSRCPSRSTSLPPAPQIRRSHVSATPNPWQRRHSKQSTDQRDNVIRNFPVLNNTPCLKKLCKIVFVRTSSNFHQFW